MVFFSMFSSEEVQGFEHLKKISFNKEFIRMIRYLFQEILSHPQAIQP